MFGVVFSFIELFKLTSKSGVFEAILMILANIFMLAISIYASISTFISFKKGSTFMKELTVTPRLVRKTKSFILFLLIGIVFTGLSILFILMLLDIVKNTVFPKALDSALLSFSVLLTLLGYTFMSYPYAIKLDKKVSENESSNKCE